MPSITPTSTSSKCTTSASQVSGLMDSAPPSHVQEWQAPFDRYKTLQWCILTAAPCDGKMSWPPNSSRPASHQNPPPLLLFLPSYCSYPPASRSDPSTPPTAPVLSAFYQTLPPLTLFLPSPISVRSFHPSHCSCPLSPSSLFPLKKKRR
jgi:hypothetical protein